jgi:hypothetical protein
MPRVSRAAQGAAPGASEPQPVGSAAGAAATLDQAALLEGIHHADYGRAIEAHRFGKAPLRHAGIGLHQEQHAGTSRRELADLRGEIAKHRLLGDAQPVAVKLSGGEGLAHRTRNRIAAFRGRHGLRNPPVDAARAADRGQR